MLEIRKDRTKKSHYSYAKEKLKEFQSLLDFVVAVFIATSQCLNFSSNQCIANKIPAFFF